MAKFGRNYELTVELQNGGSLTVGLPFTVEFDIIRKTLGSANICQIRLYNLSLFNRNQIRFNSYEFATPRMVELKAGYGTNLATIFKGNITQAWSVREGVNFITQIECFDGGFAYVNGRTDTQFPSGTRKKDAITAMAGSLPFITLGTIGDYQGTMTRANAFSGNTIDILKELTNGGFFIDQGKANALQDSEFISTNSVITVNSASGLLGTPVLEQNLIRFDMLFEPGLNVGTQVNLDSTTAFQNYNGTYKIVGVKHRGMISEAVCGSVVTTGEFVRFGDLQKAG